MQTRQQTEQARRDVLASWDGEVADLEAAADSAPDQHRIEYQEKVAALRRVCDRAEAAIARVAEMSDDDWPDRAEDETAAWRDIEDSYAAACARLENGPLRAMPAPRGIPTRHV